MSGLADLRYGLHDVCNLINSDKYSGALLSKIFKTISRILIVIYERIGNKYWRGGGNCQPLPCSYGHECNSYELGDISSNLPRLVT